MAGKKEAVFGEIPARTWRWLGVNEARVPESVMNAPPREEAIRVPAGAKDARVVVCRDGARASLSVELGEGASFHLVRVQLLPEDRPCADRVTARCAKGAAFTYTAVEAGASSAASELFVELSGDGSRADVAALYFGDGARRIDMNYVIRQAGRGTEAAMEVRGVLAGESEKIFRGTLDFARGAAGSVGREREEAVLLSPGVRNRSVPLMLSGEADVDGRHAVSIGRLDEEKLYYLMSRGLSEAEARRLAVEAQLAPILARIPDAALADEVRAYLEERISDD